MFFNLIQKLLSSSLRTMTFRISRCSTFNLSWVPWYRFIMLQTSLISPSGKVLHVILTRVEFKINLIWGANSPGQRAHSTPAFSFYSEREFSHLDTSHAWNWLPFYSTDYHKWLHLYNEQWELHSAQDNNRCFTKCLCYVRQH